MAESGELVRLVLEYLVPGTSAVMNVFMWLIEEGSPTDEELLDDFANWAENVWGVNWADFATAVAEIDLIDVDILNADGTVARNIGSQLIGLVGGVGGETTVAAAAGYIKADTALPKTRGSKYVPGLGEGSIADGFVSVETLSDLSLLLANYFDTYVGSESGARYAPGVLSRTLVEFVPFNGSGYVTDVPAYQRRRKPNVGA